MDAGDYHLLCPTQMTRRISGRGVAPAIEKNSEMCPMGKHHADEEEWPLCASGSGNRQIREITQNLALV
jgi:hypothetical protein